MLANKRGRRLSGVGIDVAAKLLACLRWRHRHRHGLQQLKRRRGLDVEGLAQRLQRGLSAQGIQPGVDTEDIDMLDLNP